MNPFRECLFHLVKVHMLFPHQKIKSCISFILYLSLAEISSGKKLNEYIGHTVDQFTIDVAFSKNDSYIFTGSTDGKLYIYDIMRKTPIKII